MLTKDLLDWSEDYEGSFVVDNYFAHPVKINYFDRFLNFVKLILR